MTSERKGKKKKGDSRRYSLALDGDFSQLRSYLNLCGQNFFFGNEKTLFEFKLHNYIASAISIEV